MIFAIIAASVILITVFIYACDNIFSVSVFKVSSEKIKTDCRVMFISDVHSKRVEKRLAKRIAKYAPTALFVGGDLWDRKKHSIEKDIDFLADIAKDIPVFYSPGNHDYSFSEREQMLTALAKKGINVLRAEKAELFGMEIVGFDRLRYSNFLNGALFKKTQKFRIMLTHFPQYFEEYAQLDIDLILAGHAHGGQFRIPFLKKGLYSPGQGIFPKYSEGMHENNGTKLIVSRGIGNTNRFPFRLFNPPEVIVIDLFKEG